MVNDGGGKRQVKYIQTDINKFSGQGAESIPIAPIIFHSALSKIFGFKFNLFFYRNPLFNVIPNFHNGQ